MYLFNYMKNRIYEVKFKIGVETETVKEAKKIIDEMLAGMAMVKADYIKVVPDIRTDKQNNSLHLMFSQLYDELNASGIDQRVLLRGDMPIDWNTHSVKERLWRPVQKMTLGNASTRKLKKVEDIEKVYDNLNRGLMLKTDGEVSLPPFPSIENMFYEEM